MSEDTTTTTTTTTTQQSLSTDNNVDNKPIISKDKSDDPNVIIIKTNDQDGEEITFKIKKTIRFGKLFEQYAKRKARPVTEFRFLFDGTRLNDDSTPEDLQMENDDTIDVVLQQTGGHYNIDNVSVNRKNRRHTLPKLQQSQIKFLIDREGHLQLCIRKDVVNNYSSIKLINGALCLL